MECSQLGTRPIRGRGFPRLSTAIPRWWSKWLATLLVLAISLLGKAALNRDELELVWYDDFAGGAVDWDKWIAEEGDGCDVGLCDWGNGEQQYYREENAVVTNGTLVITGKKKNFSSRFYTSGKLITRNKYAFRYGRAEARIKLPDGGQGLWPAFWMMPQDNVYGDWAASGEVDIFESRNNLTEVVNNLNFGNAFPNNSNYNDVCIWDVEEGTLQEFHTYVVEWDEEEFVWLMDDQEICRLGEWNSTDVKTGESKPKPAPFDEDFYLVLNLALGGNDEFVGSGPVDDSALPANMTVDWVRVFQTPEQFGDGPASVYTGDAVGGGSRQGVLVWSDDFNTSELGAGWEVVSGEICLGVDSLCENEIQEFYTLQTAVEDGVLSLTATADSSASGIVTAATSGMVHTMGGFNFTYGRLEANLSAPAAAGIVSTVSLITLEGNATSGQVEVVSLENGEAIARLWFPLDGSATVANHTCTAPAKLTWSTIDAGGNSSAGEYSDDDTFYEFAVEWTEDRFRWYASGRQFCEFTKLDALDRGGSWPFDGGVYVAASVTVGRDTSGASVSVNATAMPAELEVEAIRVYQFADMEGVPLLPAATKYVREGNLTWQDEFDGVELDEESSEEAGEGVMGLEYWWLHEEGDGCEMGICGFGNGEAQWYRKENTAVKDGKLVLTAKAEAYAGNIYTSAKLSTNTTVVVSYGRIETRIKLPSAQGLWPSIWMLPQDSPYGGWASEGAIDILQSRNYMSRAHGQLVFGGAFPDVDNLDLYQGGHCFYEPDESLSEDYHVFAVEWEEEVFRWYVDDVLYCDRNYWYSRPGPGEEDYPFPAPFDTGFYLIINMAVGGSFTGGLIDDDALAEEPAMLIDYVRVYTLEGQSVYVADPLAGEDDSSSGSGGPMSMVTAVSVLVVLAILFAICLIGSCVAKRMEKRAEGEQARRQNGGATSEDDASSDTETSPPLQGKAAALYSSAAVSGIHATKSTRETNAATLGEASTGAPRVTTVFGLTKSNIADVGARTHVEAGGTASPPANSVSKGVPLDASGVHSTATAQTPALAPSPVWTRPPPGADRHPPSPRHPERRASGNGSSNSSINGENSGGADGLEGSTRDLEWGRMALSRPKPPSGDISDDWAVGSEAEDRFVESVRSARTTTDTEGANGLVGSTIGAIGSEIEREGGGSHRRSGSRGSARSVSGGSSSSRGHRVVRAGGEWGSTSSASSLGGVGKRNSYNRSGSVCSDETDSEGDVPPPSIAGLTLDPKVTEERAVEDTGLPSYTQAVLASSSAAVL